MKRPNDPRIYIALAVVGILGGGGLLYMQYSANTELQDKVHVLEGQVRAQKDLPAQLEVSKRKLDVTRSQLAHLERNVPDFAYVPTMLKELEALGKQSGLLVIGVRPIPKSDQAKADDAKGEAKPYDEMEISVTCRGGYAGIQRFVRALNNFPKVVGTRAISIEPKKDPLRPKDEKPPLEVTARLRAYLFRDPNGRDPNTFSSNKTVMTEAFDRAG